MFNFDLNNGWEFRKAEQGQAWPDHFTSNQPDKGWQPAVVPGSIHQDLLAAGQIPDPFDAMNENKVQWVGESDWLYRCTFNLPSGYDPSLRSDLCFEGLDTFATVWLNGHKMFQSENMFVPQRIKVGDWLEPEGNRLEILFESAVRRAKDLEDNYGVLKTFGYWPTSRVYVRKAQYHYGWDWGPSLVTAGLWKGVRLENYSARIVEMDCPVEVSPDLNSASIPVKIVVEKVEAFSNKEENINPDKNLILHLQLFDPASNLLAEADLDPTGAEFNYIFIIDNPQLWWPNGYGTQPLYRVAATLKNKRGEIEDRSEQKPGLRRLRLVQEAVENEPGSSFWFEVNNVPVFCGGANWIPADSFTPRITPERYRAWVELAAKANLVMLRVWGGGIYEDDVFYNLCDEFGMLVWQDFMFACGLYPTHDWFLDSVKDEAAAAVRRLRRHPSLALWSGNNEDYQVAVTHGLYDPNFEGDFRSTAFPARQIYERLLPEVCASLDPSRPYWRGSPYGGPDANSQTEGDRHAWGVWHGEMDPYQNYPKHEGRFLSEFGMAALPVLETVESFTPLADRYPLSRTLEHHNKAEGGSRRLAVYLSDNLRLPSGLESYIYSTQFVQAEALASAYRGWRRRWGAPGKRAVGGALVWQLNDCWPVTSWAVVDYELRPKPALYVLRREMAALVVGLAAASPTEAALWAVNSRKGEASIEGELVIRAWSLEGKLVSEEQRQVSFAPNTAAELGTFPFNPDEKLVLNLQFREGKDTTASATLWPEPFKFLNLPDPEIKLSRQDNGNLEVEVSRPAKAILLSAGGTPVEWSDNMFDLMPGEKKVIKASGLGSAAPVARSLAYWNS